MSSKAKACLPNSKNGRNYPLTISAMAEEIAHLICVSRTMDEAHLAQIKEKYKSPIVMFQQHRHDAEARKSALEAVVLTTEPESLDEALALAVITISELDTAAENDKELEGILGAVYGLARWMVKAGATTPIDETHYVGDMLRPQYEALNEALERADQFALAKSKAINA